MMTLSDLDEAFVKTERIFVPVTQAMKNSLVQVASIYHVTVAQVAREGMFHITETKYPEFSEIYETNALSLLREITIDGKEEE